jgi:NADH:ubiquinone reductase (H+-translocating)
MAQSSPFTETNLVNFEKGERKMKGQSLRQSHVVVVGGGYAGVLAALRLAGRTPRARVTLINGQDHFVERIRLHQAAAGDRRQQRSLRSMVEGRGIAFHKGWVTTIRPEQQRVVVQSEGQQDEIAYDHLIYAVGSTVDAHSVPGIKEHAYTLSNPERAAQLHDQLPAVVARAGRLLVIGGGLTGIEAAAEMAERYPSLHVMLATRGAFGDNLSRKGAAYAREIFTALGIQLLEDVEITAIEAQAAHTQDGQAIPFDLCLWAGAFVVPSLARDSGVPTNARGQMLVDDYLRSIAYPAIYAIGDAAATPLRMACATAMPMGAYVADVLAALINGKPQPAPFRFGYLLQCVSLGRRRGLVQFVNADDSPQERVITGAAAAFVKESICRYTLWSIDVERWLPGSYFWPRAELPGSALSFKDSKAIAYAATE